jgi:hypothetical protein
LERLALESDRANFRPLRKRLLELAFGRPAEGWEAVLWAAYTLKDNELFAPLAKLLAGASTSTTETSAGCKFLFASIQICADPR